MVKCKMYIQMCFLCVVVNLVGSKPQYLKLNSRTTREAANSSLEMVTNFPMFRPQLPSVVSEPKCAVNSTFCESIDNYPYIHVKYILDRNSSYRDVFGKEDVEEELTHRQSSDGSFICRSFSRTVFPKIGKNKNNKWKFIINQDKYSQAVRVETCYQPDNPCDIVGQVNAGYSTFCRQKYIYSKLLSLSDRGDPAPDIFKLPSACCCAYRKNTYFFQQFGAQVSPIQFQAKTT